MNTITLVNKPYSQYIQLRNPQSFSKGIFNSIKDKRKGAWDGGSPISLCVHPHKGRGGGVWMYMQCVVLGHEYTPVTIVSTTKEPTVIFKGYSQLYKRKSE